MVPAERARNLASAVGIPLAVVTADLSASEAARAAMASGAGAIQLHGNEEASTVTALRELGSWELWKAVRVRTAGDILTAMERFGYLVDVLLLDGWHPDKLGGTGTSFPWADLEAVRTRAPKDLRIGVAGGLTPENVEDAVQRLHPDLVDVSSGVEFEPGRKDPAKVRAFVERAFGAADPGRDPGSRTFLE